MKANQQVVSQIAGVVKQLEKSMQSKCKCSSLLVLTSFLAQSLEQMTRIFDKFEHQNENAQVQDDLMQEAMRQVRWARTFDLSPNPIAIRQLLLLRQHQKWKNLFVKWYASLLVQCSLPSSSPKRPMITLSKSKLCCQESIEPKVRIPFLPSPPPLTVYPRLPTSTGTASRKGEASTRKRNSACCVKIVYLASWPQW